LPQGRIVVGRGPARDPRRSHRGERITAHRGPIQKVTWVGQARRARAKGQARRPGEGNQAIGKLFARERVADLEARSTVGEGAERVDQEIVELGLRFQIATRLTSWVAIDERRRSAGPGCTKDMPQELPYGTSADSFGLRPAAASFADLPVLGHPFAHEHAMAAVTLSPDKARLAAGELRHVLRLGRTVTHRRRPRGLLLLLLLLALIAVLTWWLVL
jgi:hypothetical protein